MGPGYSASGGRRRNQATSRSELDAVSEQSLQMQVGTPVLQEERGHPLADHHALLAE